MMPEADFWEELHRLLLQDDYVAAGELVNDQLEGFNACLKSKFDETHPRTIH
jgi:hypothetical protein